MIRLVLRFVCFAALLWAAAATHAQSTDDQSQLRQNPQLDIEYASIDNASLASYADVYAQYPFINLKANHIAYNGADWSRLRGLLAAAGDTLINILHIGDSHIQAEGSTSRTRALLQSRYGSAGRGLVTPFRMAGTNQPVDYAISSNSRFATAKLLKQPWEIDMGFSGIAISPQDRNYSITVKALPTAGIDAAFDRVRIFCSGALPTVTMAKSPQGSIPFDQKNEPGIVDLLLDEPASELTLHFTSTGECSIHAFDLDNSMTGVKYSAIGNNGATYSSYNAIGALGRNVKSFSPDLVIISLGTNEAFGNVTSAAMTANIDLLVKNIQRANPHAAILLITPADCQRSVKKRVKTGRRRYRTTVSYRHNENIGRLRQAILDYGARHHIATYDFYAISGGPLSSEQWLQHKIMSKDRIHLTRDGYTLVGDLLYDALVK